MKFQLKIYLFFVVFFISLFAYSNNEKLKFIHYTNNDGLPSSYIKSICQDRFGYIWVATRSSVCRFDGKNFKTFQALGPDGNTFDIWSKRNLYHHNDSMLIAQTMKDKFYSFNFELEVFEPYALLNDLGGVTELQESKDGFWVFAPNSVKFLNLKNGELKPFREKIDFVNIPKDVSIVKVREKEDRLVAVTSSRNLLILDSEQKQQWKFQLPNEIVPNEIGVFYLDEHNYAWLGNSGQGLFRINLTNGRIARFSFEQKGNRYLLHNLVHSIAEDKLGRIWIGTEDGLCLWSPYTESFTYYQYDINNPDGLNTNPIYNIFCDRNKNMWLGTYFGGINFWSSNSEFFKIWQAGTSKNHISGNAVSCITEDSENNIWIGMEDMGVNQIESQSQTIKRIINEDNGLSFNNVHDLLFENSNRLWIATYTGGINILNLRTNKFEYINQNIYPNLPSNEIYKLLHVGDSMFISTSAGVAIYNLKNKKLSLFEEETFKNFQVEYMFNGKNRIWFSSYIGVYYFDKETRNLEAFDKFAHLKNLNFVKTDSKNRVWVGDCLQGLWGYDFKNDTLYHYDENNDFPFSWIFSLEEGNDGYLWASGDKGLVKFKPETNEKVGFNHESGLPFEQFNFRASYKDKKGDIYFGGNTGMISFNENNKQNEAKELEVVYRGMQLFNQELVPGVSSALRKSLNMHPEIELKYKENVFTIEYTSLYFQNRGHCQYAYYLEGFEENWNYVGNRDFATYTNLSPGEYYFHVKASSDNTQWGDKSNTLKITINPPFWLSNWGFFLYFLIVVLLLVAFYLVTTRIQQSKALAEMERREKEYLTELNNFKLEFFTNVSHELRTPLTLIVGPLTRILEDEKLPLALINKMKGIKNNAHRLLALINQLLEFRKVETGREKLKVSHQHINKLLNDIEEAFAESASTKGIQLRFEKHGLNHKIWVDCQKLEIILVNIIANALKYTKEGGEVTVRAELIVNKVVSKSKVLNVVISDTGVGIEASKLPKIFNRFYRAEVNEKNTGSGSGIGLAFVNSLIKLHKGRINVESTVGKGTVFMVEIPVSKTNYKDNEIILGTNQYIADVEPIDEPDSHPLLKNEADHLGNKPTVLVVDDNLELLEFISEMLADDYTVFTAVDGIQGMGKVEETLPDLIISDVMMPGIDGFELTRRLKSDIRTSHIPLILLTAKSGEENEFEGLQTGADYYIEKPFLPHILSRLIENILTTRKNLIERFKSDVNMLPTEMAVSESDKELIEKITNLIKANIDIPNLDVSFIVNEIGISRSLLHVKLKKLTDCSATEFIRSIRLREAVKLIAEGKCNISEAAYQSGFSSPAYFSRRFKEYFGVTPKAYFNK